MVVVAHGLTRRASRLAESPGECDRAEPEDGWKCDSCLTYGGEACPNTGRILVTPYSRP